jgi:hypothetical protein
MRVRFARWTEAAGSQGPQGAAPVDALGAEQSYAGDFDSVADAFSQEPRYRRVLLGEAGAGKTVLVTELQRKLVEAPRPGDPLPVVVPAAAWRADEQSLLDWLADQLAADYGWLPVAHARALVARGMVLPILDGLDEMPKSLRPAAIARINKHHVYRPLVVTSREEEYRVAADQNGSGVKGSVAVAVQPLLPADTRRYLDPTGSGGWAEVLGEMDADGGELAGVLANPLMLWLARVEYEGKSPDNLTLFGSGRSIKRYLLDEFVPAVYADDFGQTKAGQFRCTGLQAKRWLGHLGAPVLAWWEISALAGRWRRLGMGLRAAVLCSVAAILGIWVLEQHGNWRHGAFSGPVNLTYLLLGGPVGRLIQPAVHTLALGVKGPARRDLTSVSHVVDEVLSHSFLVVLTVALVVIGVAVRLSLDQVRAPVRLQFRARGVFRALLSCCILFGVAALAALLLLYLTHWPVSAAVFFGSRSTWIALLSVSLLGLISIPRSFISRSDTSGNVSPDESLRLDRQTDVVVTVSRRSAVALAAWMFCGAQIAVAYLIYAITATVVALSVGGQNSFASRTYRDARIWLAVQGRIPWRTMAFLADANRRGVLRLVGATYQFRHARLLEQVRDWRRSPAPLDEWKSRVGELMETARGHVRWRREDMPAQIDDQADRHRRLAKTSPDAVLPEFSEALEDLAGQRWWSDERARAAALTDLLEEYQTLAKSDPALRPGLARALKDTARSLPWDEALRMVEKAVKRYRELAETNPAAFLPGLAEAVGDLVAWLGRLDRLEEALCLTSETVDTARRLADADPETLRPVLASALSDLSDWLWITRAKERSRAEESASARREAAAIYRELAETEPARYGRRLASSLDILAFMFGALTRRDDELDAVRDAFYAYRERAECIAGIRRQIAESDLANVLHYRAELTTGTQPLRRARPRQRKKTLAAATETVAAACGKLAESQPTEYLLDLAEAANGLAVELKSAGRRREARIIIDEADKIRSRYHQSVDVMHPKALEMQPLGRMDFLALRLWKLGQHQKALRAAQISCDLAPASRPGMAKGGIRHVSLAWLLSRIQEERLTRLLSRIQEERLTRLLSRIREEEREVRQLENDARFWRDSIQYQDLEQRAKKDPGAWHDLALAQQNLVVALERHSDALDTLAFQRWVAGLDNDARAAMRQANDVRQETALVWREIQSRLPLSDRSGPVKSPGTLALRLQESRSGGSSDRNLRDQPDTPPVVGTLSQPGTIADSNQSGGPSEAARTG